ncbi:MAG: Ig-like domain-containing protein [Verrucomicrobiota bacterium]
MSTSAQADVPGTTGLEPPHRQAFVTTHWSVVLTAAHSDTTQAHDARAKRYQTYWHPLYTYGRRALTTSLGPHLSQRNIQRDFQLQPEVSEPLETQVPPVVVKTAPVSGASDVDPALTELRVTFSRPMSDGGWSWVKVNDATFPEMIATPHFLNNRTCVLPVKLRPGKLYAVWLNFEEARNFQDGDGKAALPYLLIFQTSP